MRISRSFSWATAGILAMALPCWSSEAPALIVWEGEVVESWPDLPTPRALNGRAFQMLGQTNFYPAPQGEVWGLTILVEFSDEPSAFSEEQIDAWLNQMGYTEGGLNGSIRDYFLSNSNGHLDFRNEIVGFYQAQQPKSYYQGGNGYERAGELVDEVIAQFDPTVDFSRFDNDGDGDTEAISIVYAGEGGTFAQGIWPHSGSINENRDGVRLNRYMMSALGDRLGIYTFAHESGHMIFGWPDLYGFGDYCVMGNATNPQNPAGINDFYRADQGWIPLTLIDSGINAVYAALPNAGGFFFSNPADDREAFFWSNIQDTDRWDVLRGNGLLMFHFDNKIRGNDPPNPLGLAVVQADGLDELGATTWPSPGSDAADFFHAGINAEISDDTSPAARWNDGSPSGLHIYDISASADTMTFAVGNGTIDDPTPIFPEAVAGAGGVSGNGAAGAATVGNETAGAGAGGAEVSTNTGTGGLGAEGPGAVGMTAGGGAAGQAPLTGGGSGVSSGGALGVSGGGSASAEPASGGAASAENVAGAALTPAGADTTPSALADDTPATNLGAGGVTATQMGVGASNATSPGRASSCAQALRGVRPLGASAWWLLLGSLLTLRRRQF